MAFNNYDKDFDGKLTRDEILAGIKDQADQGNLDVNNYKEMKSIIEKQIKQGQTLNFQEFSIMTMDKEKMLSDVNLKCVYNYLDANGDGHLTLQELRQELDQSKQQRGKAYLEELFKDLDKDDSNTISFDEFKKAMRSAFDESIKKSFQK